MRAMRVPRRAGTPDEATGDDARLERLLQVEAPRLLSYFARRVQPVEDAADLLGDTMVVAWRRRAVVPHDEVEARMWLFGVARKVLSTHHRGSARRNALADRLRGEVAVSATSARRDGTRDDGGSDLTDDLAAALRHLTTAERDLIALVHWDGFTLAEAALLLHQSPGTIRSRYHRARRKLLSRLVAADGGRRVYELRGNAR